MRKTLLALLLVLLCAGAAWAEEAALTPAPEATPVPTVTPAPTALMTPTPVPALIAQPDATRRPIETATPRPTDMPLPEDPFIGNAVEIARRLDMLAKSSPFYDYCNRTNAARERWDALTRGDHTLPAAIYSLSGEALMQGMMADAPEGAVQLDLSRVDLRSDLVLLLMDYLLIGMDEEDAQLIQSLGRYKVFAHEIEDGCGFLVMLYEDAVPIVLNWYSDRGAVSVSAHFMPDEALEGCASASEVAAWFAQKGMPLVTFEEVSW